MAKLKGGKSLTENNEGVMLQLGGLTRRIPHNIICKHHWKNILFKSAMSM